MHKVLITTTAFTSGACSTSSIVVEFEGWNDASSAAQNATKNTDTKKNITVTAVLLNP
jgi:hypothetical protein